MITGGMALVVLGFEQSSVWGWSSVSTWACIVIGLLLLAWFVRYELSIKQPLLRLQIFLDRAFAVDTIVLGLMSIVFVPFFFFGSVYSQVALGKNSSQAGEYILWFFVGFVIAAQVGGRILDRRGARPAVVFGARARRRRLLPARRKAHRPLPRRAAASTSRSPAPASGSCSARPAPTRSTAPRARATARSPASPRPRATSAPASVSPSSARS